MCKNLENLYSYLRTFLYFCFRFSSYQFANVPEGRINIILVLNFVDILADQLAMLLGRFWSPLSVTVYYILSNKFWIASY